MELTERTAQIIRSLKFDSNAKIIYCQLPLGSITWSDEIPEDDLSSFWIGPDRDHILKLYGIRMNYWDTGTMSEEDKAYWEEAKKQFPEWPIFQRMELNEEERQAHEAVEKEVEEWIEGLYTDADEFETTTNDGVMTFSATFNLENEKKQRWWQFWR